MASSDLYSCAVLVTSLQRLLVHADRQPTRHQRDNDEQQPTRPQSRANGTNSAIGVDFQVKMEYPNYQDEQAWRGARAHCCP
eukprot:scaffold158952_cov53-Attheya_sp.AAC.4